MCVCVCFGTMTDESRFDSCQGPVNYVFLQCSDRFYGVPRPVSNGYPRTVFPMVKRPKHEAGHLFPHVIVVKNRGAKTY